MIANSSQASPKQRKTRSPSPINAQSSSSIIASTINLDRALRDVGTTGVMMTIIMKSTVRYRPDNDGDVLKAFQ